jgi:hypothetical protein
VTLTLIENGDMLCKNCKQPIAKEDRRYRGSTGWKHTNGRIFCGGLYTMTKAEPEEKPDD